MSAPSARPLQRRTHHPSPPGGDGRPGRRRRIDPTRQRLAPYALSFSFLVVLSLLVSFSFPSFGGAWAAATDHRALSIPAVLPVASALQVGLTVSASVGVAPFILNVTATATGGEPPYSLHLCPGLGSCESAPTWSGAPWEETNLTFSTPGSFTVSATVTDSSGASSQVQSLITVLAPLPLTAAVLPLPSTVSAPFTAEFDAIVSGGVGPYSLLWSFGDGVDASGASAIAVNHTYQTVGTYDPTLTITDREGARVVEHLSPITVETATPPQGQVSVGSVNVPWWVVAAIPIVGLAGILGGYVVYEQRLRRQSQQLVQALWEEQSVASETDERP